jgi:hypothetical protein
MKQNPYHKPFDLESDAQAHCAKKNKACRRAWNYDDIYAVVNGPDNDFAVVDIYTAIDLGGGYYVAD